MSVWEPVGCSGIGMFYEEVKMMGCRYCTDTHLRSHLLYDLLHSKTINIDTNLWFGKVRCWLRTTNHRSDFAGLWRWFRCRLGRNIGFCWVCGRSACVRWLSLSQVLSIFRTMNQNQNQTHLRHIFALMFLIFHPIVIGWSVGGWVRWLGLYHKCY